MVESSSSNSSVSKPEASKQMIWKALGLVAVLIVMIAYNSNGTVKVDENDCYSEFSHGQWVGHRWYPFQCIINRYPTKRALVSQFTPTGNYEMPQELENSSPLDFEKDDFSAQYVYSPIFTYQYIYRFKFTNKEHAPHLVVASFSSFNGSPSRRTCYNLADKLMKYQLDFIEKVQEEDQVAPIILMLFQEMPSRNDRACLNIMKKVYDEKIKTTSLLRNSVVMLDLNNSYLLQGLEVIVHFICNSKLDSTCCMPYDHTQFSSVTLPFLLLCLALYLGLVFVRATGTLLPLEPYMDAAKIDLNKVYVVINLVGFCIISALCLCCADRLNLFYHASPWRSPLLMFLFSVAAVCLGFLKTVKLKQSNGFMCKEQVMEHKGWTVLLILGLEYSNMADSSLGYWLWQFLICFYSVSCSYSHFLWFYVNNDYSLTRLVKVIVRQNFFMLVAILALSSPVTAYVIPIVNTAVFVLVYIVMSLPPRITITESSNGPGKPLLIKSLILGAVIIGMTAIELYFFTPSSLLFYSSNPRTHFAIIYSTRMTAVLGMLMGYYSLFINSNYSQSVLTTRLNGIVALVGFGAYAIFLLGARATKFFIICHMGVVTLPIISYCILRNWNDHFKTSFSMIFKHIGFISVELYVLSRHMLMSHDGYGLLFLFPGYFAVNMLCTLFITVLLSIWVGKYAKLFDEQVFNGSGSAEKQSKKSSTEEVTEPTTEQVA